MLHARFLPTFVLGAAVFAVAPALAQPAPPAAPAGSASAAPAAPPTPAGSAAPAEAPPEPPARGDADADAEEDEEPPPAAPPVVTAPVGGAPQGPPVSAEPGAARPAAEDPEAVFAEEWWSHARPVFEIHGYFRVRAELFHNFSLGRIESPNVALWPRPADSQYGTISSLGQNSPYGPALCTLDEVGDGDDDDPRNANVACRNGTQAGANMRFRLNPELHISDNLRVLSQIDLLDNLVLGSTPEGYAVEPGSDGGYEVRRRSGYTPLGAFDSNQAPPSAGINSLRDSIRVKRAWAEYMTPVGQLRFGRQPSHWGLGILANSGDGPDDDYQSTSDRILFATGLKSAGLYIIGAWDFANEGATSDTLSLPQAQPYDLAQLDDVDQYVLAIVRRMPAEAQALALAQGEVVLNGGMYVVRRQQVLANDATGNCAVGAATLGCNPATTGTGTMSYVRRGAEAWIPDAWFQLKYKKFRFELEAVTIQGHLDNTSINAFDYLVAPGEAGWSIEQYGLATEIEQKLVEDKLRLQFGFGWASGDPDVYGPTSGAGGLLPGNDALQPQASFSDDTISTFRFHPNYKVDLILHRQLLTRVQGTYYFRPSVEYDFAREENGQKLGGGFAAIWTRASEPIQAPGRDHDLGMELDFSLYFQSRDGALNDDPAKQGGFYSTLQYGVLFPFAGLGYGSAQVQRIEAELPGGSETRTAHALRWYMGVLY